MPARSLGLRGYQDDRGGVKGDGGRLRGDGEDDLTGEALGPAWDHVNEKALDPKEVKRARGEEICYMVKKNRKVRWEKSGKAPVSVRWVDIKSDGARSRLVARDFKGGDNDRDDLSAATPPLASRCHLCH